MAWFIRFVLLFSVLAIGIETASSSTTEKAIKSLEATLAKKFDRLLAAVNVISQAYTPGKLDQIIPLGLGSYFECSRVKLWARVLLWLLARVG